MEFPVADFTLEHGFFGDRQPSLKFGKLVESHTGHAPTQHDGSANKTLGNNFSEEMFNICEFESEALLRQ